MVIVVIICLHVKCYISEVHAKIFIGYIYLLCCLEVIHGTVG